MSKRSRAVLFRELSTLNTSIGALLAELAAAEEADEREPPRQNAKRRERPRLRVVRPVGESDELSRAHARRILREHGEFAEVQR